MNKEVKSFANRTKAVRSSRSGEFIDQNSTKIKEANLLMTHIRNSGLHAISANEKINIIKSGISKNELIEIKEKSNLDYNTLSNILSISRATLINKKANQKFDHSISERIMLLADVITYGQTVFEDKDAFNIWMQKPNKALGNKSPVSIMDTIYGIDEVKKEIGRIEYGIF